MKSLVEEASSITKAIEKAWTRAGKPQTFSVKIFENPEVGFLGFTKKSAKVGIFFEEADVEKSEASSINTHNKPHHTTTDRTPSKRDHQKKFNRQSGRNTHTRSTQHSTLRKSTTETTQNQTPSTQENASPRQERRDYKKRPSHNHSETTSHAHKKSTENREPREQKRSFHKEQQTVVQEQQTSPTIQPQSQEQKTIQPISTTALTSSTGIKRAPKFSGRRFSQVKKEDE